MLLLAWLACNGADPSDDRGSPTATTGETGTSAATGDSGPPAIPPACALAPENGQLAWCTLPAGASASARVELALEGDARIRTFRPDPALGDRVLLWGLKPARTYTWRIVDEALGHDEAGALVTGALPPDFAELSVEIVTDTALAEVEAALLVPTCPGGVPLMIDRDGDVIWWSDQRESGTPITINAIAWTAEQTVLLDATRFEVREVDLAGQVRARFTRGVHFPDYVHHDLFEKDGLVYALRARAADVDGAYVVVDGVYVFDATGAIVDEIDTAGLWPAAYQPWMTQGYWSGLYPGAIDFTHANSVVVDAAGDVIVSFRHLSAFAKFRGGPGTSGFGELLWTAVGGDASPIAGAGDFALAGAIDPSFQGQHDVNVAPDGTWLLLDNGFQTDETTRAVRYALDEERRTLTALEAWDTGVVCPILGGARALPGGNVLVTCDSAGRVQEFTSGVAEPVWEARLICNAVLPAQVPRGIPVPLY